MTAQERFERQVAHLSDPAILPLFQKNNAEDPREYLIDYGDDPYIYEFVCSDLGIEPREDAKYIEPADIRALAESLRDSKAAGFAYSDIDTARLVDLVLEMTT